MTDPDVLQEYSMSIRRLRKQCLDSGLTEEDFEKIYFESLNSINKNDHEYQNYRRIKMRHRIVFVVIIILLCIYYSKVIYSCLVCNLQDYVYPGLRLLRRISIPFISLFPALTAFYHESCLIQNPFFTVVDMDCWPCSTVNNVRQINDPRPVYHHQNAPFIYETTQEIITLKSLKELYVRHRDIFDKDSFKVLVNNKFIISPLEMFQEDMKEAKNSYIWRLNSMNIGRLLRQMIERPKVVSNFGQSTERFIIITSSQESFHIPDTECNFSFLLSLSGNRIVKLIPAEECKFQCKSLSVELRETYLLWYNWWYWRPSIQPSAENSTFIAHVGSYC